MTKQDFLDIVRRDHPEWPLAAQTWQADRMFDRHPVVEKAFKAGLQIGRQLREKLEHGHGVWWNELAPLTPEERGFVLALVQTEIRPKKRAADTTIETVIVKRDDEAHEAREDDLAQEWRERSARADKRAIVLPFNDLYRKRSR